MAEEKKSEQSGAALPRSGAAIAGLVLGIIAALLSFLPIINNLAAIIALVGAVIALVGVIGCVRGKKSGKGLAIAALVVNIAAIVIVLATQSAYSNALDKAANGPEVSNVSESKDSKDSKSSDTSSEKKSSENLAVGSKVELENGLELSVDSVDTSKTNYDGSKVVSVHVTYTNKGKESVDYNTYDWKGADAQGAAEDATFYSDESGNTPDDLSSGTLAAGGTKAGAVYFKEGTVAVQYYGTTISKTPKASWKLQ